MSTQVLQEYYVTVTSKLQPGLPHEEAREDVLALGLWHLIEPSIALLEKAWEIEDRWNFSLWDSAIVAAASTAGCDLLLTEDLSHNQQVDRVRVISPFEVRPEELAR